MVGWFLEKSIFLGKRKVYGIPLFAKIEKWKTFLDLLYCCAKRSYIIKFFAILSKTSQPSSCNYYPRDFSACLHADMYWYKEALRHIYHSFEKMKISIIYNKILSKKKLWPFSRMDGFR